MQQLNRECAAKPKGTDMGIKRRQRTILQALEDLGGRATTLEIAKRIRFNPNGVSQNLSVLYGQVSVVGGKGGKTLWQLHDKRATSPQCSHGNSSTHQAYCHGGSRCPHGNTEGHIITCPGTPGH